MKQLIYKELYLTRKTIRTLFLIFFLFALYSNMFLLSMEIGNMAKYLSAESLAELKPLTLAASYFSLPLILLAAPEGMMQGIYADYATPWMRYVISSPKTAKEIVGAKYITLLLLTGFSCILGTCNLALCHHLGNVPLSGRHGAAILIIISLVLFCIGLILPLVFYFHNQTVVNVILAVPLFLLIGAWNFVLLRYEIKHDGKLSLESLLASLADKILTGKAYLWLRTGLPILALVTLTASFFLSVHVVNRGITKQFHLSAKKKEVKA